MRIFAIDGRIVVNERIAPDQRLFDLDGLAKGRYVIEFTGADRSETCSMPLIILR
ncbi:MAG: hypothetical protein M3R08_03755 [Bacteroidota bacterium]|nr:hypothetical protein [Bacteroidota bacterium]